MYSEYIKIYLEERQRKSVKQKSLDENLELYFFLLQYANAHRFDLYFFLFNFFYYFNFNFPLIFTLSSCFLAFVSPLSFNF
jgi:hypothetical protein